MKTASRHSIPGLILFSILLLTLSSCTGEEKDQIDDFPIPQPREVSPIQTSDEVGTQVLVPSHLDKITLWQGETQLRGANIWQRVVVPDLDGPEFLGSSPTLDLPILRLILIY